MTVPGADIEVIELTDYLAKCSPFDRLTHTERMRTARALEVVYAPRNEVVLEVEADNAHLFFVRKGAVELTDADERLVERLGEEELFGYPSLIGDGISIHRVVAIEDTLLYRLPGATFHALREAHPWFAAHFEQAHAARLHAALRERADGAMLAATVRTLLSRPPVTASPETSIKDAALLMNDERVSSLLILEDGALEGVITDRDFRARVVAKGLGAGATIADIMTRDPITVRPDSFVLEALLEMSRHNIHHLPVVDEGQTVGMITTTDLMRQQAASPVHLVSDVFKQQHIEGLAGISKRVPRMVRQMMDADARSEDVGRMVTAVVDALTQRLITLAEAELGAPPVDYCWVALGSQARQEQTAHSDQDNALIIDDAATDEDMAYFAELADRVCAGLDACGYVFCPGGVMASNEQWRVRRKTWMHIFSRWIETPEPAAILHATIFFDMRPVAGRLEIGHSLLEEVYTKASKNSMFQALIARDALRQQPPLGFFRNLVLRRLGVQDDTFDLKHQGVLPIVDLSRAWALEHGVARVGTHPRLDRLEHLGALTKGKADDVRDAYEFIGYVRLRHQAGQLARGEAPDNIVSPKSLSSFERRHLRDAFNIIGDAQSALSRHHRLGLMG